MTTEQMFERLWTQYPADLCKGKRGGRQPAFRAFKKINPDEKEFNRIMANMKAMIKSDRLERDPYRWPFVSSYLNQARYDDFIVSKSMDVESQPLNICSRQGCKDNVHGSGFTECSLHMPSLNDIRYTKLVEAKKQIDAALERNQPGFADRCMAYAEEQGFIFSGKKKEKKRWQKLDTAPRDGTVVDLWDIGGFKVDSVKWDTEMGLWSTLQDDSRYGYWMEAS